MAAITALLLSLIVGPYIIRVLKRRQIGEEIRGNGPPSHLKKAGTPTMGGFILLISIFVPMILFANFNSPYTYLILFTTLWMGLVGFWDDYLKVVKKKPRGLVAKYKLAGQILLGFSIGAIIYFSPKFEGINSITSVPFFKNYEIDFGWFYIPMVILVITATSNAVNLTDGLDGLAIGTVGIAALAFAGMSYVSGHSLFSDYLNIIYLPGSGELTVYCAALVGAALGFLWYNCPPAQVFMGDTGSLALGGALGALAVLIKKEFLLLIVGGVFVMEVLSVILQRGYFKYTKRKSGQGRRLFRMAPLHHHFELKGWPESRVVVRFWILGILFALFSLSTFKIR